MKFILCEFQEKFMQGKNSYEHGLDMDANYATNKPLAPCFTIMIKRKKKPINFHIHFVLEKEPILRCTLEQVIFAGCYFLYILTKSPMFGTCILFEIAGRQ